MNKDNAHLYLPLVKALAEGKTIQLHVAGTWQNNPCPDFSADPEFYRIKPEPRVIWVNEYLDDMVSWPTEKEANNAASNRALRVAVKYVEAVE